MHPCQAGDNSFLNQSASGKKVLVIVPHEDDEINIIVQVLDKYGNVLSEDDAEKLMNYVLTGESASHPKPSTPPKVQAPVVEKVEPKVESVVVSTTVTEKVIEKPQPVVEVPKAAAPPADPSPKRVSIGGSGVQWSRSPKLSVSAKDLENQPRSAMVLIEADGKGKITNARITRSSGLPGLDEKILRAVKSAKFKPYMENGVAYPIRAEQPFDLSP